MKRLRTCIVGGMSTALLVSLGLGSWAYGQECTNDAGTGDIAESEACLTNDVDDTTDYGCNDLPGLFITLSSGDFTDGVVEICGGASTMENSQSCPVTCDVDDDCPAGASCIGDPNPGDGNEEGTCSPVCLGPACDTDADCPDGVCVGDPNPGDGNQEGLCNNGETCVDGLCVGGNEPSIDGRDTDWYLIPQDLLSFMDHPDNGGDGNGVIQVNAQHLTAELDMLIFVIDVTRDPGGQACDVDDDCPGDAICEGDPNPGDGNADGTCQEQCDAAVFSSPHGCITGGGEACDEDGDCHSGDCVGDPVPGDGNAEGTCTAVNQMKTQTLVIDDHPDGVAVWTGTGFCSGAGNWGDPAFFCSTDDNDYILEISFTEAPTACAPGSPRGPCNEPNEFNRPGCEDPDCCALVCDLPGLAVCCLVGWDQGCANAAIDQFCAPDIGSPVFMATGPDQAVDGYLRVKADPYGSFATASFGGTEDGGDLYNPAGDDMAGLGPAEATFSNGYYFFIAAANQRQILANNLDWQDSIGNQQDGFVERDIPLAGVSVEFDHNTDGTTDGLTSMFTLTGPGLDLTFELDQRVANPEGAIATLTQTYTITNGLATPITFDMNRQFDGDFSWVGDAVDDSVGTATNGVPSHVWVFQQEVGTSATAVTHSAAVGPGGWATEYCGAKQFVNPLGDPELCPDYGFGSDTDEWDSYGLPDCWVNHIALVGYDLNGTSGNPDGADDVHCVLVQTVTVPGSGSAVMEILHTYGQQTPYGLATEDCPCDCADGGDGTVNVVDFLALIGEWGTAGACDCADGGDGTVNVVDFLAMIGVWGPC
jgi:hypothetical protein